MVKWKKYATRDLSIYKTAAYLNGLSDAAKKHFKIDLGVMVCGKNVECVLYLDEDGSKELSERILNHTLDAIRDNKDPLELMEKIAANVLKTAKNISIRSSSKKVLSKKDFIRFHNEFLQAIGEYQIVVWWSVLAENGLFLYAKNRLRQITNKKDAWETIICLFEPSVVEEERISLLNAAANPSKEIIEEHACKFSWMNMRFFSDMPLTTEQFTRRINEIKNPVKSLRIIKDKQNKKRNNFFNLLNSLNLTENDRTLFVTINRINLLRQTRDRTRRTAFFLIKPFYEKLNQHLGCDYDVLLSYSPGQITNFLKKGIRPKTGSNVMEFSYIVHKGKEEFINHVEHNDKNYFDNAIDRISPESAEIRGTSANKGNVIGVVKTINLNKWKEDINSVKKGDILVAVSTKPDYVVAMEKAAAFVTDEGGLTCHAAIIAREMGKPCIVGTQNATKVLNDGDLVEVNATKGAVRILKRN
ncbi:MAG: PEP-utilizing enzyme [Nanoarchaeota archaeon]|nr:PEP-utilizing enzyme [Nanoarchaeota archaeon]